MTRRPFDVLRQKMSPESRERSKRLAEEILKSMPETHCGCCGRGTSEVEVRKPLPGWTVAPWNLPEYMCVDCLFEWYDGGETNMEKIKTKVLAKAGRS